MMLDMLQGRQKYIQNCPLISSFQMMLKINVLINFQTRCTYQYQGNEGGDAEKSAQCILAQNIINQKIYLVLWYWLVFLIIVGVLQIIFEVVIFAVPSFRIALLTWNIGDYDTKDVRDFLHSKGVADWFIFYQISKNTDKQFFCLLLKNMSTPDNMKSTEHNDLKGFNPSVTSKGTFFSNLASQICHL